MKLQLSWFILLPVVLISALGIAIIWSVNPALLHNQLIFLTAGLMVLLMSSRIRIAALRHAWLFFYLLLVASLLFVFTQPAVRGSRRWLFIGNFNFQPAELGKPFYTIALAGLGAQFIPRKLRHLILFLGAGLLPIVLVLRQPDLGDALLYLAVLTGLTVSARVQFRYLLALLFTALLIAPFGWKQLADYQKQRLISFISPTYDIQGVGYNATQALIAVGSGTFQGRGLRQGTQSHLRFLPESHTDFIFASLTEELGFLGGGLFLLAYGILLYRLLTLAVNAPNRFSRLLSLGIFIQLFSQMFINVGMNIGLVPITGVTLPLVSYGGSSIISTFVSLGLMQAIANSQKDKQIVIR